MAPVEEITEVTVTVTVDEAQRPVPVTEEGIAGRDLRQRLRISDDRDLWREASVDGLDELVEDEQIIVIEEGVRLFTVARHITPGR